jgi:hypothetical protein
LRRIAGAGIGRRVLLQGLVDVASGNVTDRVVALLAVEKLEELLFRRDVHVIL